MAAAQAQPAAGQAALYQPLAISADEGERVLAIDLSPGAWAVGSRDGPPATETQLRAVLQRLAGIRVGGRCAAALDHGAESPCDFALQPPDFAAIVVKTPRADLTLGWAATTAAVPRISHGFDPQRYFGLLAPERFLGSPIVERGASVALRFRAGAPGLPAGIGPTGAWLILVADEPPAFASAAATALAAAAKSSNR